MSSAPSSIGCTSTAPPICAAAARTASATAQVERDPAGLGLVRARGGRLDDDRHADRARLLRRPSLGRRGDDLGSEGDAVGLEQPAALVGVQPDVVAPVERSGRRQRARRRDRPRQAPGTTPSGRRSHRRGAPPRRARAPPPRARRTAANGAGARASPRRSPVSRDGDDRLARTGAADRRVDRALDLRRAWRRPAVRRARRRRRMRDRRGAAEARWRTSRPSRSRAGRSDCPGSPRPASPHASARAVAADGCGSSRPSARARVGEQDPEPACVREHRDPRAERQRLRREQDGGIEELRERARAQHAGLAEERVDGSVRARERGRVGACGARSRSRGAALEREHRLAARHAARDAREARAGCRSSRGRARPRSWRRRPPSTRAGRWRTRRPCSRARRRPTARGRARGPARRREAERTALRCEADAARRRAARGKGRVEAVCGCGDAEAVRADQPAAVRAHERQQRVLARAPSRADLGEARRDDAERANAGLQRVRRRLRAQRPAGTQMTASSTAGSTPRRLVQAGHAGHGLAAAVDRVGRAREAAVEDVAEELAADRSAAAREAP